MPPPSHPTHLAAALLLAATAATLAWGCDGRPRGELPSESASSSRLEPHLGQIDLRGGLPERGQDMLLASGGGKSFGHLILELRSLGDESNLRGLFVRFGTSAVALAQAHELGRQLGGLRRQGTRVTCHADGYTNSTMLLAALSCDEIWLSPAGTADTVGLAAQLVFGRAALDKLEIGVDFIQEGKFKGASEPYTRDSSSPEARQSLQSTLAALRRAWLDSVAEGRGKSAASLGLEDGPHTPADAVRLGLIDKVGGEAEARQAALAQLGIDNVVDYFGGDAEAEAGVADLVRALSGTGQHSEPHIAVVRAVGAITLSPSPSLFASDSGIVERRLSRVIRRLKRNPATKAVVLRIDSPGGSALASDLLWQELHSLREKKPVVASVGSMAASGGYYIASAASKIVAEKSSIVGSIGVVGGKLSFGRSLKQIGITVETVPAEEGAGARALYASALSPWDEATRVKIRKAIVTMYDLFIDRVATGRGLSRDRVSASAEGRIMGGEDARKGGLIDEIGGLTKAISVARELAESPEDIEVVIVDSPSSFLDALGLGSSASADTGREAEQRAARLARRTLIGELPPLQQEIATLLETTAPLLQGERVIAALPFALIIR